MSLLSITLVLFFIMDPLGNVSSFLAMLKHQTPRRQMLIICREMAFALLLMLIFHALGEHLKSFLGLQEATVHLSAGLVLFLAALGILFPGPRSMRAQVSVDPEPYLVPLAIPLIAGPALLATIMLYSQQEDTGHTMLIAIILAWAISVCVLLLGRLLSRILGRNGLMAAERLIAMVLVMIAIQRFLEGVRIFLDTQA